MGHPEPHPNKWECKQTYQKHVCSPQRVVNGKDPEPHPNNGNASSLVKGKLPHQKVRSMGKILNHTPTMGTQAAL